MMKNYIRFEMLKDKFVYKVYARNFSVAIYFSGVGFKGIRTKFNDKFVDTELHYDECTTYGTVRPIETIEEYKGYNSDEGIYKYLERYE